MNEAVTEFLSGKTVKAPFEIQVEDKTYYCLEVLRFLPGRRVVLRVRHQEQVMLLKLFAPNQKGRRELFREQHGYRSCMVAGVPVPQQLLSSDNFAGCLAVAYDFLPDAQSFSFTDENHESRLKTLLDLMVSCHQGGIYQDDIHTDNILLTPKGLYLIDLASVRGEAGKPLSKQTSLKNLALLVAQFVPDQQRFILDKLNLYYQGRSWRFDSSARADFTHLLDKAWQKRKNTYLKKCFRSCTMTVYRKNIRLEYAFKRDFYKRVDAVGVEQMDKLVEQGRRLKAGNSATVVLTQWGDRQVVIKRYNIKSIWHLLKRCWRPSRAANSWRQGNLMALLGIETPQVLGFVEQRFGPFRAKAYLVTEYLDNASELSQVYKDKVPVDSTLKQVERIFALMRQYRISHGDMKASNLLLTETGQVALIDLDAMQEHCYKWMFERAFGCDQHRFLKNWSGYQGYDQLEKIILNSN